MKLQLQLMSFSTWLLGLLGAFPLLIIFAIAQHGVPISNEMYSISILGAVLWLFLFLGFNTALQSYRLRILASLLQALREGDYSLRARGGHGLFRDVWQEFNALASQLGGTHRAGIETDALLSQLLAALDYAVLVVDHQNRLVDLNPAAEALLGNDATTLVGRTATELQIADWLIKVSPIIDNREFKGGGGPWEVRRLTFRRQGQPHQLVVVTDVSRALREVERRAWRRLIRVLGHEINNSLGPIQSTAGLLKERYSTGQISNDTVLALGEGLELIERRSKALGTFIRRYADLARLPPPNLETTDIRTLIQHVASLETRLSIVLESESSVVAQLDPTQLEQALINLVRNAADAALETAGGVRIRWGVTGQSVFVEIEDDGPGITYDGNLFVPFFTTKPGGSGVGLVLARQIIEAHGGTLHLFNRKEAGGTIASIRLRYTQVA